jgi:hypothetical protein
MAKTFESPLAVAPNHGAVRSIGAALYFLITPERGIAPHRIHSDQIYHHYAGDPLEVLLLPVDGAATQHVVGSDLTAGMLPQLLIPARTFHFGRLADRAGEQGWSLLGTTSWPAVAEGEFEYANVADLLMTHAYAKDLIARYRGDG